MESSKDAPGKASRWFGVAMPKSVKTNVNILHQEKLIAQKKREIEAKMERQAKQNHLPAQQASQGSDDDSGDGESGVSNKFANDGSFLQQFLKLQKEKQGASSSSTETSHPPPASTVKKPTLTGKRPNLSVSSMLNQVKNYTHSKQTPVTNRLSVFQSPDDEEEEDYEQWLEIKKQSDIMVQGNSRAPCTDSLLKVCPPEDIRTRRIVEKLAKVVAEGGPEMEKVALEDCKDNPVFAFLHDKNSPEFLYYRKKLAEMWKKGQAHKNSVMFNVCILLCLVDLQSEKWKMESEDQINLVTVGCVSWGHRTDSVLKVSPPEDEETKDCAEKLARFVADGGPVVEMVALKNHRDNQSFSSGYKYYRQKLEEFRKANSNMEGMPPGSEANLKRKASSEGGASSSISSSSSSSSSSSFSCSSSSSSSSSSTPAPTVSLPKQVATSSVKKKRKSRWGPEEEKVDLPPPELAQQTQELSPTPLSVQDLKGLGYEKGKPVGLVGVTELSDAQKKQLKEQQEIMWERTIKEHQSGYDSDEEIDNELGTWEHQLRRMEMDKTREMFQIQNVFYLVVVRVHTRKHCCKTGKGAKKANQKGVTAVDGAGFGIDRPADLSKNDDEYEAFRKRMMLAYRFRPNPLVRSPTHWGPFPP
ncbi:hypothetical protein Chor_017209, partial [Crotalus horridus]